jgi:hypothetical protein
LSCGFIRQFMGSMIRDDVGIYKLEIVMWHLAAVGISMPWPLPQFGSLDRYLRCEDHGSKLRDDFTFL